MSKLILIIGIATALALASPSGRDWIRALRVGSGGAQSLASLGAQESRRAEQLYLQVCASCHGNALQGGTGPSLQNLAQQRSPKKVERIIRRGKGRKKAVPMPGGLVSNADAAILASWLTGEQSAAFARAQVARADKAQTTAATAGEAIYLKACAACHGSRREGGVGPALEAVGRKYPESEIEQIILSGRTVTTGPSMPGGLVSSTEAAVVAEWLAARAAGHP